MLTYAHLGLGATVEEIDVEKVGVSFSIGGVPEIGAGIGGTNGAIMTRACPDICEFTQFNFALPKTYEAKISFYNYLIWITQVR
jgi:hypothetical protein